MKFMPFVSDATLVKRIPLSTKKHTAVLLDNIKSAGSVKYRYILAVYDHEADDPCLLLASEENVMAEELGGGSHFLGLFPGDGRYNLGSSDDWANIEKFEKTSVEIATKHLSE